MSEFRLFKIMIKSRLQKSTREYLQKQSNSQETLKDTLLADPNIRINKQQVSILAHQGLIEPVPTSVWSYQIAKDLLLKRISLN